MTDTIRIDPHEPCEVCGSQGTTRLYMLTYVPVVWCKPCYERWDAERIAANEARLLAEWGTRANPRGA